MNSNSFNERQLLSPVHISFLPTSVTEQWVLSSTDEEIRHALDDVFGIYSSMSLEKRQKCKNDVKVVIAQIHSSMVGRDSLTSQKCFELLDFLAKDHVDQFVGEFHLLLPQIEKFIADGIKGAQNAIVKFASRLVSNLKFLTTANFVCVIMKGLESDKVDCYPTCLQLMAVSLLHRNIQASTISSGEAAYISRMIQAVALFFFNFDHNDTMLSSPTQRAVAIAMELLALVLLKYVDALKVEGKAESTSPGHALRDDVLRMLSLSGSEGDDFDDENLLLGLPENIVQRRSYPTLSENPFVAESIAHLIGVRAPSPPPSATADIAISSHLRPASQREAEPEHRDMRRAGGAGTGDMTPEAAAEIGVYSKALGNSDTASDGDGDGDGDGGNKGLAGPSPFAASGVDSSVCKPVLRVHFAAPRDMCDDETAGVGAGAGAGDVSSVARSEEGVVDGAMRETSRGGVRAAMISPISGSAFSRRRQRAMFSSAIVTQPPTPHASKTGNAVPTTPSLSTSTVSSSGAFESRGREGALGRGAKTFDFRATELGTDNGSDLMMTSVVGGDDIDAASAQKSLSYVPSWSELDVANAMATHAHTDTDTDASRVSTSQLDNASMTHAPSRGVTGVYENMVDTSSAFAMPIDSGVDQSRLQALKKPSTSRRLGPRRATSATANPGQAEERTRPVAGLRINTDPDIDIALADEGREMDEALGLGRGGANTHARSPSPSPKLGLALGPKTPKAVATYHDDGSREQHLHPQAEISPSLNATFGRWRRLSGLGDSGLFGGENAFQGLDGKGKGGDGGRGHAREVDRGDERTGQSRHAGDEIADHHHRHRSDDQRGRLGGRNGHVEKEEQGRGSKLNVGGGRVDQRMGDGGDVHSVGLGAGTMDEADAKTGDEDGDGVQHPLRASLSRHLPRRFPSLSDAPRQQRPQPPRSLFNQGRTRSGSAADDVDVVDEVVVDGEAELSGRSASSQYSDTRARIRVGGAGGNERQKVNGSCAVAGRGSSRDDGGHGGEGYHGMGGGSGLTSNVKNPGKGMRVKATPRFAVLGVCDDGFDDEQEFPVGDTFDDVEGTEGMRPNFRPQGRQGQGQVQGQGQRQGKGQGQGHDHGRPRKGLGDGRRHGDGWEHEDEYADESKQGRDGGRGQVGQGDAHDGVRQPTARNIRVGGRGGDEKESRQGAGGDDGTREQHGDRGPGRGRGREGELDKGGGVEYGRRQEGSVDASDSAPPPSNLKSDAIEYLASADIHPSPHPSKELARILAAMNSQDWSELVNVLTMIRRLSLHHPQTLTSSNGLLHSIVQLVVKQVDNLRSVLAKNGLLTIEDLCTGVGRNLDADIGAVVAILLKRCGDTSGFLSETAVTAMHSLIKQGVATRVLNYLLLSVDHKNALIRGKVAGFLYLLVQQRGLELRGTREMDTLKARLSKLLEDQAPEARAGSRNVVRCLVQQGIVSRSELEHNLSVDLIDKALRDMTLSTPYAAPGSAMTPSSAASSRGPSQGRPARGFSRPGRLVSAGAGVSGSANGGSTMRGGSDGDRVKDKVGAVDEDDDSPHTSLRQKRSMQTRAQDDDREMLDGQGDDDSDVRSATRGIDNEIKHLHNEVKGRGVAWRGGAGDVDDGTSTSNAPKKRKPTSNILNGSVDGRGDEREIGGKQSLGQSRAPKLGSTAPSRAKVAAARRELETNEELLELGSVLQAALSKNWTERRDALTRLSDLIIRHGTVLKDASKLEGCMDRILERVDDGSVKVAIHALFCLERLQDEANDIMQVSHLMVLPALLSAASSSNKQVNTNGLSILREFVRRSPSQQVAQQLCAIAAHDKERMRAGALRVLRDNMARFCDDIGGDSGTDAFSKKSIFPVICQSLFGKDAKGDVRAAGAEALKALQSTVGREERLWKWVDDAKQQNELKRLTAV